MITQAKFEKVSFEQFYKDFMKHISRFILHENVDEVFVKRIYDKIELPTRATQKSAGYDFKMPISFVFEPNDKYIIPTGIRCVNMEDDMVLEIYPRSGLGFKYGFRLNNTVGIIDADYESADNEGHIMVCVKNDERVEVEQGKGFCQGIFIKYYTLENDNTYTSRTGGMGSTDN